MKSELLAKSPMLILPLCALFVFLAVFLVMFVMTMRKRAIAYDPVARLPLDDDQPHHLEDTPTHPGGER